MMNIHLIMMARLQNKKTLISSSDTELMHLKNKHTHTHTTSADSESAFYVAKLDLKQFKHAHCKATTQVNSIIYLQKQHCSSIAQVTCGMFICNWILHIAIFPTLVATASNYYYACNCYWQPLLLHATITCRYKQTNKSSLNTSKKMPMKEKKFSSVSIMFACIICQYKEKSAQLFMSFLKLLSSEVVSHPLIFFCKKCVENKNNYHVHKTSSTTSLMFGSSDTAPQVNEPKQ